MNKQSYDITSDDHRSPSIYEVLFKNEKSRIDTDYTDCESVVQKEDYFGIKKNTMLKLILND